jgi:hypothetical protein
MTDTTQGADAPDDGALFNEAVTANADTLAKFENPLPVAAPEKTDEPPAGEKKVDAKTEPPKPDDSAPVPSGRFREESEARRRAERERDDLRAQLAAFARVAPPQQQAPQQPPQKIDIFDNPQGYVRGEIREEMLPVLEQIRADFQNQREAMSLNWALDKHGEETVSASRQALEAGMSRGDPNAWNTYNRAMQSHDPYGVIVRWHREGETLRTIGGDLEAYRKRVLEEALADPEYRKRAIEAAKGQATNVHRPAGSVTPPVTASPSLGNVGAAGGDEQLIEPDDMTLFRAATQAKRR